MKNTFLKLSFFTILSFFIFINITDTTHAQTLPVPDKTELIEVNNEIIPAFHFDDPNEADLHRIKWAEISQNYYELTNKIKTTTDNIEFNEIESQISPNSLGTSYAYKGYLGTAPYKYKFNVYENRTSSSLPLTRTVTNSASTSTTISVGATFKSFFKTNVGVAYNSTQTFKDKFELNIPPRKQGEIWSWNYAKKYSFDKRKAGKTTSFTTWRPTDNYGSAVYYLDFRDPS